MSCFFFNDTATTEIYTLSLHDALPIWSCAFVRGPHQSCLRAGWCGDRKGNPRVRAGDGGRSHRPRSEEHTSELQSRQYLVCRLLLEKKKNDLTSYLMSRTVRHTLQFTL